eukprot:1146520-Pelagomonas_calceolata.AAC.5
MWQNHRGGKKKCGKAIAVARTLVRQDPPCGQIINLARLSSISMQQKPIEVTSHKTASPELTCQQRSKDMLHNQTQDAKRTLFMETPTIRFNTVRLPTNCRAWHKQQSESLGMSTPRTLWSTAVRNAHRGRAKKRCPSALYP